MTPPPQPGVQVGRPLSAEATDLPLLLLGPTDSARAGGQQASLLFMSGRLACLPARTAPSARGCRVREPGPRDAPGQPRLSPRLSHTLLRRPKACVPLTAPQPGATPSGRWSGRTFPRNRARQEAAAGGPEEPAPARAGGTLSSRGRVSVFHLILGFSLSFFMIHSRRPFHLFWGYILDSVDCSLRVLFICLFIPSFCYNLKFRSRGSQFRILAKTFNSRW